MAPVKLYVYDLSNGMARAMSMQLTGTQIDGIWHTSIVAYGKEVYYAQGIEICPPGGSHHGNPLQIFDMGETEIDEGTFDEYIDDMRSHYTAEKYHLLDFNCNSFTNDVVGFLTGGTIPSHIKDLPSNFLSTPFGQSMRPMIDNMYRRPTAGVGYPTPSATPPGNAFPGIGLTPEIASSLLQNVAAQASSTGTSGPAPGGALTSHLHISTNVASFENALQQHRAVVVFFSSSSADSNAIEPAFERLARDKAKANSVAFVKVDKDVGTSGEIATKYGFTISPSFQFYYKGNKTSELNSADQGALTQQVDKLLRIAFAPHPHTSLNIPTVRAMSLQPILYTQIPSTFDTPVNKLVSFIETASGSQPSTKVELAKSKRILQNSFTPFLKKRFPPGAATKSITAASNIPVAMKELQDWTTMTSSLLKSLNSSELFPLVDLWRLAILDSRIASSEALIAIQTRIGSLVDGASMISQVPRPLLLTALRLFSNVFAHHPSGSAGAAQLGKNMAQVSSTLVACLLHTDVGVRTAAASLAFNVAATRHSPLRKDYWAEVERREAAGEGDADIELVCALLEALEREKESEEVVHRLTASLAFFLYLSPSADLRGTLEVLGAKDKVLNKAELIEKSDVKMLVYEVGDQLCA